MSSKAVNGPELPFEGPRPSRFNGATFDEKQDSQRLGKLLAAVRQVMADGAWRTLAELQAAAGGSEASVSARLRDLRKPRFGNHWVERRRRGEEKRGLWEYKLTLRTSENSRPVPMLRLHGGSWGSPGAEH